MRAFNTELTIRSLWDSVATVGIGVAMVALLLGCGPKEDSGASANIEVGARFVELYDRYVQGDEAEARASLLATVDMLEGAELPKRDAVAHGLWLTFSRLHVLESRLGNLLLADAYLLKARYWYLRKLELSGEPLNEAMEHVSKWFTPEECKRIVDGFDIRNTGGAGANYFRSGGNQENGDKSAD
jgi:hypothetical protein